MPSHNSVAKAVRLRKAKFPQYYCSAPGCLFAIETALGKKVCPKHGNKTETPRFDYSRRCECGAPYDNDLKGFSCAD